MPILTLQIRRSDRQRIARFMTVYVPRPVPYDDEEILRRYYLDPVAQQRLNVCKDRSVNGRISVVVFCVLFGVAAAYTAGSTVWYTLVCFGAGVVVLASIPLVRRASNKARRTMSILSKYARIGVFDIDTQVRDAGLTHSINEVPRLLLGLAPVPRLFRIIRRPIWMNDMLGVKLEYLLSTHCAQRHPHLHDAVDSIVARYVCDARRIFEQLLSGGASRSEMAAAQMAIDEHIDELSARVACVCQNYTEDTLSDAQLNDWLDTFTRVQSSSDYNGH